MSEEAIEPKFEKDIRVPGEKYTELLEQRQLALKNIVSYDNIISNLRLILFLVFGSLGLGFVYTDAVPAFALVVSAFSFLVCIVVHSPVVRKRRKLETSVAYFEKALRRLRWGWMGEGDEGQDFKATDHLYSADLDLFGKGSVFELICQARTGVGRETLAQWLLTPASLEEMRSRQSRVKELSDAVLMRESLAVSDGNTQEVIQPEALVQWVERESCLNLSRDGFVFWGLFAASITGLVAWNLTGYGSLVFLGVVIAQGLVRMAYRGRVAQVLATVSGAHVELEQMARVLAVFEDATLTPDGAMKTWREGLNVQGESISNRISGLRRLVHRADAMKNQLFMLIGFYFGWDHLAALRIEAWRLREKAYLPGWLKTLGEFEALVSLSSYAFENPENVYPTFVQEPGVLEAKDICHPLLRRAVAVGNDIGLGPDMPLLMISGSNMSGKSTLLRGVGVNIALGACGAPVRAAQMNVSPFQLGATLSIQDSLMSGASRFYAEISRIQGLVQVSRSEHTLLFLIDEILHGTNSFDRRKGARAILESILNDGSVGFVTTHDLALAQMADEWPDRATNMHLSDRIEEQALVFDYQLRPGIVSKSNAIELMRSIGLPV